MIRGIYPSVEEFKKHRNAQEYVPYSCDNGRQFVIYGWNIFSTLIFVQECLKRFGAPGTGKSYLAKEIAADIISNGLVKEYALLTDGQKKRVEFVQFHPSYDYSDFVEGLRPRLNDDGTMGFDAKTGYYLYPEAEGIDDLCLWLNKGYTYEENEAPRDNICVIKHGLKIPANAESYEAFVSMMEVSEQNLRQALCG